MNVRQLIEALLERPMEEDVVVVGIDPETYEWDGAVESLDLAPFGPTRIVFVRLRLGVDPDEWTAERVAEATKDDDEAEPTEVVERTIVGLVGGPVWVISRVGGVLQDYARRYPTEALAEASEFRGVDQTYQSQHYRDVEAEWNGYCENHEWTQDPARPQTWEWRQV